MLSREELEQLLEWDELHTEGVKIPPNPNVPWRQKKTEEPKEKEEDQQK